MKLANKFFKTALLLPLIYIASGAAADANLPLVDFEHLGEPLNSKKFGEKEKSLIKKLNITANESSYREMTRVVGIAGASGLFVFVELSDNSADGRVGWADLITITSLNTGKNFSLPNDGFRTLFTTSGTSGKSTYIRNNKGELVSILYVGNYVQKFKGKNTCNNLGAMFDVDGKNLKLVEKFVKKPLGKDCFIPSKQAITNQKSYSFELGQKEENAFFDRLFTKAIAN